MDTTGSTSCEKAHHHHCIPVQDDCDQKQSKSPSLATYPSATPIATTATNPAPTINNGTPAPSPSSPLVTLTAKYGKQTFTLSDLPSQTTTIAQIKQLILQQTNILPKRQKFIGLELKKEIDQVKRQRKIIQDECTLDKLYIKKPKECTYDPTNGQLLHAYHTFILMGTPEEEIFIDPDDMDNDAKNTANNVINDFDIDFNVGSSEWKEHFANQANLIEKTNTTEVHIMNPPRQGKKLMVLDLDHTLLDFSSKKIVNTDRAVSAASNGNHASGYGNGNGNGGTDANNNNGGIVQETIDQMKRPYMDEFLSAMYVHYDLVVWSQTSWRWLETKLVELGMLTNPNYRFCFVLDKTSMFAITSMKRNGQKIKHYVKPLQIIWSKFPNIWNASNTIHLDDLSRNFALNLDNGLKVTAYYRKKRKGMSVSNRYLSIGKKDVELVGLIGYCTKLAKEVDDFRNAEFEDWKDVVNGTKDLVPKK